MIHPDIYFSSKILSINQISFPKTKLVTIVFLERLLYFEATNIWNELNYENFFQNITQKWYLCQIT